MYILSNGIGCIAVFKANFLLFEIGLRLRYKCPTVLYTHLSLKTHLHIGCGPSSVPLNTTDLQRIREFFILVRKAFGIDVLVW